MLSGNILALYIKKIVNSSVIETQLVYSFGLKNVILGSFNHLSSLKTDKGIKTIYYWYDFLRHTSWVDFFDKIFWKHSPFSLYFSTPPSVILVVN